MTNSLVHSFGPIADRNAEVLILGSMPGRESLKAVRYYAHPQNVFWKIMAELLGLDAAIPYAARLRALRAARIALWDVLRSCRRAGSMDSKIEPDSITANDFPGFFRRHGRIRKVVFNGAKAEACFRRLVLPGIGDRALDLRRLPSTSPANASYSYARKLAAWRAVLALRRADAGRRVLAR